MAIELAAVYVPITPSLKGAGAVIQRELGGVDLSSVGSRVGGRFGDFVTTAFGAAAGIGLTRVVSSVTGGLTSAFRRGFSRLDALDQATAKLDGLGHSAESVDQIMKNALNSVRGTAFGLDAAAGIAGTLVASGVGPGQELERVLKLVADSATIAGTDLSDMGSIFGKVAANGKLNGEVLQQLLDRQIGVLPGLAKMYGVTNAEAQKMVSDGKVSFEDFAQVMEETLGGAALKSGDTFRGAVANIGASLGRIGAGLLGGVFPKIAPSLQAITTAMAPLEDFASSLGERVGNFLAPAMDHLVGVITGDIKIGWLTELTGGVTAMIQAFKDGGNDLTSSGFAGVLESIGLAARSIVDSGILAFASPFSLIFAALSQSGPVVASALADVASQITQALGQALPYVVQVLGSFAEILATVLPAVLPVLSNVVLLLGTGLAGALTAIGPALGPIAVGVLAGVAAFKAFTGAIRLWTTITGLASAAQVVFNAVLAANPIGLIVTAIAAVVAGLIYFFTQTELGQEIWANFMSFLSDAWTNIVNVATTVWNTLADFFGTVWGVISDIFTNAWNGIVAFLTPIFEFIGGLIQFQVDVWKNIFLVLAAVLVTVWQWISKIFTDAWNGIVEFVTPIVTAIVDFVVGYFTMLFNFWAGIWTAVSEFFTNLWQGILDFLIPIVLSVFMAVQGPIQALSDWWMGVWSAISGFFSGIWNGMVEIVSGAIGRIGEFVGGIYDTVMGALGNAGEWLLTAGGDVVRGFWGGIVGMGDWLFKQVTGFFDGVIGWAKDTLGIQSPSRVFRMEVGQMVGAGMALGIEDSESTVQHAMDSLLTVPAVPTSPLTIGDAYTPAGAGGASGAGFQQTNYFEHMDPEIAIEAAGQRAASIAERVGA